MLDGWRCLPISISKVRSGHQKVVKKIIQGRWNREALEAHSPKIYFRALGRSENPGLGNYLDTLTSQIIMQQILLIFEEKNTYTTLLGPTRLLISESLPSKPDLHLHK